MNNKIVCIYPIDKTTEFLLPIFERLQKESNFIDYRFDTNDTNSVNKMKDDLSNLEQPSFIVFLGHVASYCLYGTPEENKKKVLFSADDLSLFQNHNCFFLSCRSSEYLSGKAQSYIGFGDIPTDYLEIISERDLGDIHYMCGIDETDIELYKKYIVDIILHTIDCCGCDSLLIFYNKIKLYINKRIADLLVNKEIQNYRLMADLLYSWKSEIEYRR